MKIEKDLILLVNVKTGSVETHTKKSYTEKEKVFAINNKFPHSRKLVSGLSDSLKEKVKENIAKIKASLEARLNTEAVEVDSSPTHTEQEEELNFKN